MILKNVKFSNNFPVVDSFTTSNYLNVTLHKVHSQTCNVSFDIVEVPVEVRDELVTRVRNCVNEFCVEKLFGE